MTRRKSRLLATIALGAIGSTLLAANPKKPEAKSVKPPVVVAPLTADVVADSVRAEQDAVLRRLDVCDRLRKLGETTGNTSLIQQAEDLEKQVTAVYSARVARLGVKGGPKAEDESTNPIAVPAPPAQVGGAK